MAYTAVLDDYAMLQDALKDVGTEFTEKQAKDMAKYADRLIITAGQFGVDMTKRNRRALWEDIARILERARLKGEKPPLSMSKLGRAKRGLRRQLKTLSKTVEKNSDDYLASLPSKSSTDTELSIGMSRMSSELILRQIGMIQRIKLRQE
jgi:hypothetical protein